MDVYKRLDSLLTERGISRRQLAIISEIPPSTLQSALMRQQNLTIEALRKIAEALDVNINWLLTGAPPVNSEKIIVPAEFQHLAMFIEQFGFSIHLEGQQFYLRNLKKTVPVSVDDLQRLVNASSITVKALVQNLIDTMPGFKSSAPADD